MSICGECSVARGRVCCEVEGDERLTTLTFSDIARIERETGLPGNRFVELEELSPDDAQAYEEARPLYRGLFASGTRYGLKARNGACVFLERGKGCTLSDEAKPIACRLFPFDLDALGRLTLIDAPHCLALERADGKASLLAMFGMSEEKVRALLAQAREEAREHAAAAAGRARRR